MASRDNEADRRVVIVGGGFGGLEAAKALSGAGARITLVDRTNHHLFQPLLYQVATAALSPAEIAEPIRAILRGRRDVTVVLGDATGIDVAGRRVLVRNTDPIPYDTLILATGSAYSWFGHDTWSRYAAVLKTLVDADLIRQRVLEAFDWAESRRDEDEIASLLTFVVVGGGPTGIELAGSIAELARSTLKRDYRRIDPAAARIILVDGGERLLAHLPEDLSAYARTALAELGVDVRLGANADGIDGEGVIVAGERIRAANVFWCAGTEANPAAAWLGAEAARNKGVRVLPDCSVPGHPEIFCIGDVASQKGPDGKPLPGLAPVAKQQGRYVGRLVAGRLRGEPPPGPFRYRDYGTMAVIGRSRAVADFGRVRLTGLPAWLAWSLVHLVLLLGFRNRLMVYLNWVWQFLTYGRGARLAIGETEGRAEEERRVAASASPVRAT